MISTYQTGKHFAVTITDGSITVARKQDQIDAEAALDGFSSCAPRSPQTSSTRLPLVTAYKNLKYVERDFRHIKSDDLDLRPVSRRLEERLRAHVLICMLACSLSWHLRRAWAPLTFTDQDPPAPDNPVAPARRSAAAQAKASYQHDPAGRPSWISGMTHSASATGPPSPRFPPRSRPARLMWPALTTPPPEEASTPRSCACRKPRSSHATTRYSLPGHRRECVFGRATA